MTNKTISNLAKMSKLFQPMSIEILDKKKKEMNFKVCVLYLFKNILIIVLFTVRV